MAIQIDQVLTRGMTAGNYRTLGDIGSDHYPVRVDLVI
jgi:endonuclease/exonuclease/phosphatase (EEP) superfamily protein YafD